MVKDILMSCIQGFTEFLPVSSSGHLVLFQDLFSSGNEDLAFNVFLHGGTLLSVLIMFRKDIQDLVKEGIVILKDPKQIANKELTLPLIAAASVPTAILGIAAKKMFPVLLTSPITAGLCFPLTMAIVYMVDEKKHEEKERTLSFIDALFIGTVQGLAVLPGISRSGATVGAAVLRGCKKERAFSFSFLMSIPAIAGALLLESKDIGGHLFSKGIAPMFGYFSISCVCGIAALVILKKMLLKRKWKYFAGYLFLLTAAFWIRKLL